MVRPFAASGLAKQAADKMATEDWSGARADFKAYKAKHAKDLSATDTARLQVLVAHCNAKVKNWREAATGFSAAATRLTLLANYLSYQAARAFYFAKELANAQRMANRVASDSLYADDATLLLGDILRARGQPAATETHYQNYLGSRPKGIRRAEARFRLAQALAQQNKTREAYAEFRGITIAFPVSRWAERAQPHLDQFLSQLPKSNRNTMTELTTEELLQRGHAHFRAMRNPKSAADFTAVLDRKHTSAAQRCEAAYHAAQSWFKERKRQKSAPLFDRAGKLCAKTDNQDLRVKAAYQAGRSYVLLRKYQQAAQRFRTAETLANNHSYADDARLRQAEAYASLNNHEQVTKLLATIPTRYPQGDMRAEALWRLAWTEYQNKRYDTARDWLRKQIQTKAIDDNYWAEGQAQYWLGRTLTKLGKTSEAITAYTQAIETYPLSYYALLALNRLRENHSTVFTKLTAKLRQPPANYDPAQPAFHFRDREEYHTPGFKRALELLRLGFGREAQRELAGIGLAPPPGKKRVKDPQLADKLWAMAFLNHRARRYSASHWVTRWHIVDYKRSWPTGHNRARWRIAYPKAYWGLIERFATKHGYPTSLQIAIVREESAFEPRRESWANAIGLTQMIFPTARRFGKGTGIAITRHNLRDPEKNVTIGSNFLSFLWSLWDGHVVLIPPSYNAGENAVRRWLKARGTLPADEWLETIAADQPRRYTKRVLATYFAYSYLDDHTIPRVSNTIGAPLLTR